MIYGSEHNDDHLMVTTDDTQHFMNYGQFTKVRAYWQGKDPTKPWDSWKISSIDKISDLL